MDTTDRDLKKSSGIEQKALIGKMHKMQWLRNNSQFTGHKKLHPVKELTSDTLDNTINEGTKEESEVASANVCSNIPELNKVDSVQDKSVNEEDSILNKEPAELPLNIGECSGSMDTVLNKDINATDTLFPNPQTPAVGRTDEKEVTGVPENIVTGELEQVRLEGKESKSDKLDNESENDWNHINRSKSDNSISNQTNPKQCHDNNNNNAKSKSQSALEAKKSVQKTAAKVNTNRRISDPKIKKPTAVTGDSLKESTTPLKQGSKSKDDLSNDDGTTSTDLKKISVGTTPKLSDKKVNACNKNLTLVKETRMKEQQFSRQQFPMQNGTPNKNRLSMERDDKTKSVTSSAAKLKPRSESDRRSSEPSDEPRRCHKVQVTRTQSYNVQYNRNKPVIKPQQRYVRSTSRPEEDTSVQNSSGFNNNNVPTENMPRKKFESQQPSISKQVGDKQSIQSTSGKNAKSSNVSEHNLSDRSLMKTGTAPCRRSYQNLTVRTATDRNFKDDQTSYQKFKRDTNVYRRSSSNFQIGKDERSDEQKKNVNTDSNVIKDHGVNRLSSGDPKAHSQSDGSKLTVYPHGTSNGASNTNKTDTLDSIAINNVQSAKSLNFSSSTKDSTIKNTSQESQVLRSSCNETEVQYLKTEQEDTSNNNMSDKTSPSNSETKSVKFSDNIREITVSAHHPAALYPNSAIHQSKLSANTFYPDIRTACNAQQTDNHQSVQTKTYFDDNNAQYNKNCTDVQSIERDLHMLNLAQQKSEQNSQITSSQSVLPPNSCNSVNANSLNYQNLPEMYLNQHSNAQTVPRKTADSTIVSQSTLIPSTSSYAADTQNLMQTDPSNLLMHTTQTSVLPQSGFHNPLATQPNHWNLPLTDMYLMGNVMNSALPLQNSRHACNADFSNMQQPGYVHPMFYVPQLCMQSWNPLLHYPAPLFQNAAYASTFSNPVLPANNLTDYMNCSAPSTPMQNIPYKPYQQMQSMDNNTPNYTVPMKLDNYMGNVQGCKSTSNRMKDNNNGEYQMRASQYRVPVPNEYQSCSQDGQLIPFSYAVLDSTARNVPTSMHVNQKYVPCTLSTANYSRMPDMYHGNRDTSGGRQQDDPECGQPMISPKDVMNMNYGINYSRKTDMVQSSSGRTDKPAGQMHFANAHHYAPHYQKNTSYQQALPKEVSPKVPLGRGVRKMDQ